MKLQLDCKKEVEDGWTKVETIGDVFALINCGLVSYVQIPERLADTTPGSSILDYLKQNISVFSPTSFPLPRIKTSVPSYISLVTELYDLYGSIPCGISSGTLSHDHEATSHYYCYTPVDITSKQLRADMIEASKLSKRFKQVTIGLYLASKYFHGQSVPTLVNMRPERITNILPLYFSIDYSNGSGEIP